MALNSFQNALTGLRQFLATESPLRITKNAFYFKLSFFSSQGVLKIFYILIFWSCKKTA